MVGLLAAFAVVTGLRALSPTPATTVAVLVAAHDLPAGTSLTPADLTRVEFPPQAVPEGAITADPGVTARLSLPLPAGTVLTRAHLGADGWDIASGQLAIPVRFADPLAARLISAGDHIDLIRATGDGAEILASSARVLATLDPGAESAAGGILSGAQPDETPLVLLAVPRSAATLVLDASAAGALTLALGPAHSVAPETRGADS